MLLPVIVKAYVLAVSYTSVELAWFVIVTSSPETDNAGPVCDVVFVIIIFGGANCVKVTCVDCCSVVATGTNNIVYVSFVTTATPLASIEGYCCLNEYLPL